MDDAKTSIAKGQPQPAAPVRKTSKKRKRKAPQSKPKTDSNSKIRYASILNMEPPYSLDKAEKRYKQQVKLIHPDNENEELDYNSSNLAQLREALEFFRTLY